jgi:hypothetical protein
MPRISLRDGNFVSRVDAPFGRYESHSPVGSGTGDTEISTFARKHEDVVLTNDLDFQQILAHTRRSGPSVVLLRGEPLQNCASELMLGAIVSLDWSGLPRARVLPLHTPR